MPANVRAFSFGFQMVTRKQKEAETVAHCGNCRYFKEEKEGYETCRRNPPQVMIDEEGNTSSVFPPIVAEEFCGCWAPKLNA